MKKRIFRTEKEKGETKKLEGKKPHTESLLDKLQMWLERSPGEGLRMVF